jgi:hypothetical protein
MRYLLFLLLLCLPCLAADTYYVWPDAAGSGTGADWTNAYTTLEAGIAANIGDITGVAGGHIFECKVTTTSDTHAFAIAATYVTDADSPLTIQSTDRTYKLVVSNDHAIDDRVIGYVNYAGLYVETAAIDHNYESPLKISGRVATNNLTTISHCTFKGANDADTYQSGLWVNDVDAIVRVWNTLCYNISQFDAAANCGILVMAASNVAIYNCTVSGGKYGINTAATTANLKNCLVVDSLTNTIKEGAAVTTNCINCMVDDTVFADQTFDDETGSHDSLNGGSVTFTGVFRLAAGDAAIDQGADLSADTPAVSDDIDGKARGATYDIGCSEYVAASGMNLFRRRAITW